MEHYCIYCNKLLDRQKRKFCNNSCKCKYFYKKNPDKCNLWNKNKPRFKNNCIVCGKNCGRKRYCSTECQHFSFFMNDKRYNKYLISISKRKKSLSRKNKGAINTRKNNSRFKTKKIFNRGLLKIDNFCKICKSNLNIEIHHEEYPTTIEGIKKAIKEGKIYYLCKFCHSDLHKTSKDELIKQENIHL